MHEIKGAASLLGGGMRAPERPAVAFVEDNPVAERAVVRLGNDQNPGRRAVIELERVTASLSAQPPVMTGVVNDRTGRGTKTPQGIRLDFELGSPLRWHKGSVSGWKHQMKSGI